MRDRKRKGKDCEGTRGGKGEGEKKPPLLSLLSPSVCFPQGFHSHYSQPKGLFTGWLLHWLLHWIAQLVSLILILWIVIYLTSVV